jgi:3-hydroxyisobutyrate dehydrogenase-like beta-hydroxyacid dehydrogenase
MLIAVLGTGMVGDTIASKLVKVGHRIMVGSRTAESDAGQVWLLRVGGQGHIGTFADAAAFGEIVFDCTNGAHARRPPSGRRGEPSRQDSHPGRQQSARHVIINA